MVGKGIGVDLGTTTVIIYVSGKGIVLSEPSVVAKSGDDGRIISIGSEAGKMVGKNPRSVRVIKPMSDGVVSDFEVTEQMLGYFLQKVCGNSIFKPHVIVCMPSTVTNLEKRTILDVVTKSGAGSACLIEEPLAAAVGAGLDVSHPFGTMVVDIGGGTTDIAVITMGSIAVSSSIKVAGNKFDRAIMRYVRNKKGILIGEQTAELIKKTVGCAVPREVEIAMTAKGKNYLTGMPQSFEISSGEAFRALRYPVQKIYEAVRSVFEMTPPELAADISSQGIILTGGGAMLYGMADIMRRKTGINAVVADDPINCVAKGMGEALINSSILTDNGYDYKIREEVVGIQHEDI